MRQLESEIMRAWDETVATSVRVEIRTVTIGHQGLSYFAMVRTLVYSCHTNVVYLSVYFCYTTLGGLFLLHWSSSPLTNRNVVGTAEGGFQRV